MDTEGHIEGGGDGQENELRMRHAMENIFDCE